MLIFFPAAWFLTGVLLTVSKPNAAWNFVYLRFLNSCKLADLALIFYTRLIYPGIMNPLSEKQSRRCHKLVQNWLWTNIACHLALFSVLNSSPTGGSAFVLFDL